jgi:hypothetical protein
LTSNGSYILIIVKARKYELQKDSIFYFFSIYDVPSKMKRKYTGINFLNERFGRGKRREGK